MTGPLEGLRVVDLTEDLGRFGTKLLAEAGATVVRNAGSGTRGAPMVEPEAAARGGVLDWWYDGGKLAAALDLNTEEGQASYRQLAIRADLIIESQEPGRLRELQLDHEHLVADNPGLTQVSLTPFGRTGPWSQWESSDLVAGALGGVLSITGLPEQPLNSWGGQNENFGGFAAVIAGLAGVRQARRTGVGQLADLSLHEVVTGSIENLFFQYFFDDLLPMPKVAQRQGSLHWLGAYEVAPARSGHVMITPTPSSEALIDWMVESGSSAAQAFVGKPVEELLEDMPSLMSAIKEFLRSDDAGALFTEAQSRHIAFGEVQSLAQAAGNPQYAFRDLYGTTSGPAKVHLPARLVRYSATPVDGPKPPPTAQTAADLIAEQWSAPAALAAAADAAAVADSSDQTTRPLDGLRVLDLSWVLAGPFATRLLGDLGAAIIKVQHEGRATLVNLPSYPYYNVWNRSKRSATINLKHPDALAAIRRLVEQADVLVENYSSGVLSRLGLGWEDVRAWNPKLVYVSMSGPGHEGPWKDVISYAPTVHALCGLTHLTNPANRGDIGCGFSLNDHAAGFASAFAVLAALDHADRTGEGQYIDMAQLEIGTYILGPGMVDYLNNDREAQPLGNRDALNDLVPNEVYATADGFVAVTATSDEMWQRLSAAIGGDESWSLTERRLRREEINALLGDWAKERQSLGAAEELQAIGVAAGHVQDAESLFASDPQHQQRGFWHEAAHMEFGLRPFDRFPALWSIDGDLTPYRPAPAYLGEANFEVWSEVAGLEIDAVAEGIGSGLFS